jgi:hypothetical protein
MSYRMQGIFLEACDCQVSCPCWLDENPDEQVCTGLIAWYVDKGTIDEVDVSNLTVVSVSRHEGNRHDGGHEVVLIIEESASDGQAKVLEDAFSGRLGGPLEELKELSAPDSIVRRAPIKYTHDGKTTTLSVGENGDMSNVEMFPLVGALGRVTTLADSALARVLGTPAEVGKSTRFHISVNRAPLETDVENRSASRGRFSYSHHPGAKKVASSSAAKKTIAASARKTAAKKAPAKAAKAPAKKSAAK